MFSLVTPLFRRALLGCLLVLAAACHGKKAAVVTASSPADSSQVTPAADVWDPNATLPLDGRKALFANLADADLSGWDRITKCEISGNCTHVDAVKWKILYFFDHPALDPQFQRREHEGAPCGNPHFDEIRHEIAVSPELKQFYEAILAGMETNATTGGSALLEKMFSFVQDANADVAVTGTIERITSLDGSLTFAVDRDDPNKDAYRFLNRKRTVTAPGGRLFDLYWVAGDESFAAEAEGVVTSSAVWTLLEKEFQSGITPHAIPGQEHPTVFIVNKPLHDSNIGIYMDVDYNHGYIAVTTNLPPQKVKFVRGKQEIERFKTFRAVVAHEIHHFVAGSFFHNADQFSHRFLEAHAEWFSNQVYHGEGFAHIFYPELLYKSFIPFDHVDPSLHKYASALFWDFLSCRAGEPVDPVRRFNQCIAAGQTSVPCTENEMRQGSASVEATLLQFSESVLNLSLTGDGVVNMQACDPAYQPYYLLGVAGSASPIPLMDGVDYKSSELQVGGARGVERFSLVSYVFAHPFGDNEDNFLKVDLSDICLKPGMACSLLGFRIDKQDRSKYSLVMHEQVMAGAASGVVQYIATATDSEPDILILLVANGNVRSEQPVTGKVRIETRPFSRPAEFLIEQRTVTNDPLTGGHSMRTITFTGTLDVPDENFPVKTVPTTSLYPMTYTQWDYHALPPHADLQFSYHTFVPLKTGEIRWQYEALEVNGACPSNVIKTFTRSSGAHVLGLTIGDGAVLDVDRLNQLQFNPYDGHERRLLVDYELEERCEPCCPFPPASLRHETGTMGLERPPTAARVPWRDGATSYTLSAPDTPEVWGTLTLPEPLEPFWNWTTDDHFEWGGLYGGVGTGILMYQFKPPLIDEPDGVRPAQAAQPDLPASLWE